MPEENDITLDEANENNTNDLADSVSNTPSQEQEVTNLENQENSETLDVTWSVDTSLNQLNTVINLDALQKEVTSVINPKDWVKDKVDRELQWESFYEVETTNDNNVERTNVKLEIQRVVTYFTKFVNKTWVDFRESVSPDQLYTIMTWVQVILVALWNADLKIDWIYGPRTKEAIITFQEKYNETADKKIRVDWILWPETIFALITEIQKRDSSIVVNIPDNNTPDNNNPDNIDPVVVDPDNNPDNIDPVVVDPDNNNPDNNTVIITPDNNNNPDNNNPDHQQESDDWDVDQDESVEVLRENTYWNFDSREMLHKYGWGVEQFKGENMEQWKEIILTSVEDLRFFTNDADILSRYNEQYFQTKHLAIKYFTVSSPYYYDIIKAEKSWNTIKMTYKYVDPHSKYAMWLLEWECLYVECGPDETVEWTEQQWESNEEVEENTENDNEIIEHMDNKVKDLRNKLNALWTWEGNEFNFSEWVLVDGKLTFDGTTYEAYTAESNWPAYKIDGWKLIIWNFQEWELNGIAIEYSSDTSFFYGNFENGKRNGIGVESLVDWTIYVYLYQNGKISVKEDVDSNDKRFRKLADIMEADIDWLSNLIEKWQEKSYPLDAKKIELYFTQQYIKKIINLTRHWWEFKEWVENSDGWKTTISLPLRLPPEYNEETKTYEKIVDNYNIDDTLTGDYYSISDDWEDLYICSFVNWKEEWPCIEINSKWEISKWERHDWRKIWTWRTLKNNWDIFVDEYNEDEAIWPLYTQKMERWNNIAIDRITNVKSTLNTIVTINSENNFELANDSEDITFEGQTYKKINDDEVDSFNGFWYRITEEDGWDKYFTLWYFKNGELDGEAFQLRNNWVVYIWEWDNGSEISWIGIKNDNSVVYYDFKGENGAYQEEAIESEDSLIAVENKSYSERLEIFDEAREDLNVMKEKLEAIIRFNFSGNAEVKPDCIDTETWTITFDDKEYKNWDAEDFSWGLCYTKWNGKITFWEKDGNGHWIWECYTLKEYSEINKQVYNDAWELTSESDIWGDWTIFLEDMVDKGRQSLRTDWTMEIGKMGLSGDDDSYRELEKPDQNSIEKHINDIHDLLANVVEYDESEEKFNFKDGISGESSIDVGWCIYTRLSGDTEADTSSSTEAVSTDGDATQENSSDTEPNNTENSEVQTFEVKSCFTFGRFNNQDAFIIWDFVDWKLTWYTRMLLADGSTISWNFEDNKVNGVYVKRQPNGAVYTYKCDQWREISSEKVADTSLDSVNQAYMNDMIKNFMPMESNENAA